ncbi:MAG: agmatine deiminase family protein [Bdellovibrionales bacterium]|nr:agmatine deiminase family protein [Bdellovibrionales bacterium]
MRRFLLFMICIVGPFSQFARADDYLPWPTIDRGSFKQPYFTIGKRYCNPNGTSPEDKALYEAGLEWAKLVNAVSMDTKVDVFVSHGCMPWVSAQFGKNKNVNLFAINIDSIWVRDFGGIWLRNLKTRTTTVLDTPTNRMDNAGVWVDAFPQILATILGLESLPFKKQIYDLQGGNFQVDEESRCFLTDLGSNEKRASYSELLKSIGCRENVFLQPLPLDGTKHLDMFFQIVGRKTAVLAEFLDPKDLEAQQLMNENARLLKSLGYRLIRLPYPSPVPPPILYGGANPQWQVNFAYTNFFLRGKTIYLPTFASSNDDIVRAQLEREGFRVRPLYARKLADLFGLFHCISNERPMTSKP